MSHFLHIHGCRRNLEYLLFGSGLVPVEGLSTLRNDAGFTQQLQI
jgi:hypothetical protein